MEDTDQAQADTTSQTAGENAAAATPPESTTPATATESTTPDTKTTSTEKTPEPYKETGSPAVGVEGYERSLAEAKAFSAQKAADAKQAKFESAREQDKIDSGEATPPAEAAAEAKPPEGESPPAAEAPETAAAPPGETPAAEEETKTTPERIRLAGLKDGHLVAAANSIAREENIPFAEAWDRVAPKKAASETVETKPATDGMRSREDIEKDIKSTKAEKKQAATDLDTSKMYDSDEKIEALKHELDLLERAEYAAGERAAAAEQRQFSDTVTTARAKATEYWPEAADEKSDFSKRMDSLADELAKDPDPEVRAMIEEPDAPFVIAKLVAKELGVLPKHLRKEPVPSQNGQSKPSTPAAATKPAPVNQRAVGRPAQPAASPASGSARTTQGGSPADALGLDKIHSVTDYEKAVEKAKKLSMAAV